MIGLNKIYKISFLFPRIPICRYYSTSELGKSKSNYYKILDIKENATVAEIKAAFHKKAKEHHPDAQKNGDSKAKEAEEKFKQAVEAYKTLSDEAKRKEYDETLKPKASASSASAGWDQYTAQEGFGGSRTRYAHEKFYGDAGFGDNVKAGQQGAYWQGNDGTFRYQGPPPPPNRQTKKANWDGMNYEYFFVWYYPVHKKWYIYSIGDWPL